MSESQFAPIPELVADIAAGRMVILVDDEGRENEGDVILAADHVTPEAINFMARHCRGLICLTLTPQRCDALQLPAMVSRNGSKHGTAFTVSIEAASGIATGISAADRAHTVRVAVSADAKPSDIVHPGHVFPLRAAEGGVLMRAGHTEAGCDLARMAGRLPASVICEIMNDDGTMARVPDLIQFARQHQLKLGTIADLIRYRSRHEHLVSLEDQRPIVTAYGRFDLRTYRDRFGGTHLALSAGDDLASGEPVMVRVHEPLSVLDVLDIEGNRHSWPLAAALGTVHAAGRGVVLLLNTGESSEAVALAARKLGSAPAHPRPASDDDLRTYGVGAQILRHIGISRMQVLGNPRRFPSMGGFGLHAESFVAAPKDA